MANNLNKIDLINNGYYIDNGIIKYADLSIDHDACVLRMCIDIDYWSLLYGGQYLGGISRGLLTDDNYNDDCTESIMYDTRGCEVGMASVIALMRTVGVNNFSDLKGKYVRIASKGRNDTNYIIGNIVKDIWFDKVKFFEEYKYKSEHIDVK